MPNYGKNAYNLGGKKVINIAYLQYKIVCVTIYL